jgi:hypothetical protein
MRLILLAIFVSLTSVSLQGQEIFKATGRYIVQEKVKVKSNGRRSFSSVEVTTTRYLVSEDWCVNCPAAKSRFLSAGNSKHNIININTARTKFRQVFSGIPFEFVVYQPKVYRREKKPVYNVEGTRAYTREELLRHLRSHSNHRGKHWQKWYLENWGIEKLQALHDDDHLGGVP